MRCYCDWRLKVLYDDLAEAETMNYAVICE